MTDTSPALRIEPEPADANTRLAKIGRRRRQMVWFLLANIILVAIAVAMFGRWDNFLRVLSRVDATTVFAILGLALVNYLFRAIRYWHLNRENGVQIPFVRNLLYYVAGFSFSVTPGKVGELVRIWLIRKDHDYPIRQLAPPVFVDRLCDLIAALVMCACAAAIFADQVKYLVMAGTIVLGGFALFLSPKLSISIINRFAALARTRLRLFASLRRMVRQIAVLLKPAPLTAAIALSVVAWGVEAVALRYCLSQLGVEITLAQAIFIFAFANLIGAMTFVPGGLGGTEAIMVALMVALNTPVDTAIAVTLLIRACTLWFGVSIGLVVSFILAGEKKQSAAR